MNASLSTHVLDTARGVPADGVGISLYRFDAQARTHVAGAMTNTDGRIDGGFADLDPGTYELVFTVGDYFERSSTPAFYDEITVRFRIADGERHYHVPLLLSPWGYTTYRGS